tara:strand:- start:415 stop:657 length:243 start_codon:yes stop_codon:yes gene_type:complete
MGKYLTIVLAMMIVTMAIAFISPLDGGIRVNPETGVQEPLYPLFWVSVAGAVVVIIYNSYQNRKKQQELRRERRRKFKKK